jgi:hypothetical protein
MVEYELLRYLLAMRLGRQYRLEMWLWMLLLWWWLSLRRLSWLIVEWMLVVVIRCRGTGVIWRLRLQLDVFRQ